MANMAFEYIYRSGEQKRWAEVIFENRNNWSLGTINKLLHGAMPKNLFVAAQVRVHEVFFEEVFPGDTGWHEYWAVRHAREHCNDPHHRDITDFIAEVQFTARAGWKPPTRTPTMEPA